MSNATAGDPITVTVTPSPDTPPWIAVVDLPFTVQQIGAGTITLIAYPNTNSSSRVKTAYIAEAFPPSTLFVSFAVTQDGTSSTPPSITNLVPKGGESYVKRSSQVISWT